jgi:TRAP-type C4-dicarboxylate transport system permease small subunit
MVNLLFSLLRRLSTVMAVLAGASVLILALLIVFDIVARRFAGFSVQGTDEIGGYVLALVASMGFAYVLFERGFTRIDLVVRLLPRALANIVNVLAYVSLAAVALFFAQKSVATYMDTLLFDSRANTPLQTPMWIPQGFWVAGMCFFALCSVLYALRALVLLFVDGDALAAEYGIARVEEEVSEIAEISAEAHAQALQARAQEEARR